MPRFSANLSMLYQDRPFLDRFAVAAADGFTAVEHQFPYEAPKEVIAARLKQHGLTQVLFNLPAGDWAGGERGIACLPDRVAEFRAGIDTALAYARALDCTRLNALAGIAPAGVAVARLEDTLVDNLGFAAGRCAEHGIRLLVEPINSRDIPGFLLTTTAQAERLLARVAHPNLFIQYDFYHLQIMQGDLVPNFARLLRHIAHVQIADTPGRHEPGSGEIDYGFVLGELDRLGYDGWVGCEYVPLGDTSAGLSWMRTLGASTSANTGGSGGG